MTSTQRPRKATKGQWNDEYYEGDDGALPNSVIEWAGLDEYDENASNPLITRRGDRASDLNDTGHSFKQIANLIERNL